MANQNGRNSSMSDDDRMSWRPQDDHRDDEDRMYGRDRDERRSWDDRWDRNSARSIDRGGQGQSGYGAGRHEGDRSFSTGYDDRYSARNRFDNYGHYLGQGGQQMGEDRDYRSGYEGRGQGGYGSYGSERGSSQREQYGTHGYGGSQGQGVSGGYAQHAQGMQGYGQQGWGNETQHQYGSSGQWGMQTPSWNTGNAATGSVGTNMGQPGVGGTYNTGYQGSTHGYIGADRPFSHHYGSQQHHGQSNFAHQGYSHLGQQHFGHLGPQQGAHMSGGGQYQQGQQRWGNEGYQQAPQHESVGQRIKGWFQDNFGHRGKGPMGYARSDERIRETVCEALSDDDRVDASNIEVTVKNGEVTLTGTVEDRQQKRMAEDCVENLSGVKDVQNQIRVVSSSMSTSSSSTMSRGSSLSQNVDLSTTGSGTSVNQNGTDKRHKA